MFVVLGDTHRRAGHGLVGRTLEAVRLADTVAHTGDFTTSAVYEEFQGEAAHLFAVAGNNDAADLHDRLPTRAVFEAEGLVVALVHGHEHTREGLSLLGREVEADVVAFGHSHRPEIESTIGCTLLNPGSHAQPRWYRPAHAELSRDGGDIEGRLVQPDGTVLETFRITP